MSLFGGSSVSSAFAQGGLASINSSGWVVGGGSAKGGDSGFPWGFVVAGFIAVLILKRFRGSHGIS